MSRGRLVVNAGVVAAVAALAVGLLLPGVARVRGAAARSVCEGRHKQLAVALCFYAEAHGRLPAGTVSLAGVPPEGRLSWVYAVLPYMEGRREYERFDPTLPADHPHNLAAGDARLRWLLCPASDVGQGDAWRTAPPVTHLVAVGGVGPDAAGLPGAHPRAGVVGHDRGARLAADEVPDGLTNTLLLIETGSTVGHWARGGWGALRHFDPAARPHAGAGRAVGGLHPTGRGWASPRRYTLTMAFADGSVRSVGPGVAPEVLEALGTAAGGERLPADW